VATIGGRGGLIVVDRAGEPAFAFTTEGMYRGCARGAAPPEVAIYR
jgi:beta-aspartyl-peptidase (threonine type)